MHTQSLAAALRHQHCDVLLKHNSNFASHESDSDHCLGRHCELRISVPNHYPVQEIRPQKSPLGVQLCDFSLTDRTRRMPNRGCSMERKVWIGKCDLLESLGGIPDALHHIL